MVTISDLAPRGGNEALDVNPTPSNIKFHITTSGSSWLWTAFCIFMALGLTHCVFFGLTSSRNRPVKKYLLTVPLATNIIMAYTYFTYASNLGYTSTNVEFHHIHAAGFSDLRQVFYVKFIGWFLCWPFSLVAMEVATSPIDTTSGGFKTVIEIFTSYLSKLVTTEIYVLGLLIGALINSDYRWGYFSFAVSAQLVTICLIGYSVIENMRSANSNAIGATLVILQLVTWVAYPVCWGISEGGNVLQPDSEAVFYGILDVVTFGIIPSLLTLCNLKDLNEDFFNKLLHTDSEPKEKSHLTSPRASGDTVVQGRRSNA